MERKRQSLRVVPVCCAVLVAFSSLTAVADDLKGEEEVKPLIVMVRSAMPSGVDEVGAGIIFGQRGSSLYVLTANHVVRQGAQDATRVRVQFRWLPGEDFDARLLADADAQLDWAVLKVENVDVAGLSPDGLPFARLGEPGALRRGDKVFLIGNPTGHSWDVNVTPDGVTDNTASSIFFESVRLEPGHSGGALLDENRRVVGLLKSSQAPHGEAVNISAVLSVLASKGYPVSLARGVEEPRVAAQPSPAATPPPAAAPAPAPAMSEEEEFVASLAAKGETMANGDPLVTAMRMREPAGAIRRGFDIGMATCDGHTAWGPGKQKLLDSLTPAEQRGFVVARDFSLERNNNMDFAFRGAAIAAQDPAVAAARAVEPPGLYTLGFDIATGIFGDPALGAQGNTATGPGSLGIRDKLSAAGQRGFNAAVAFHLRRNYRPEG